MPQYAECSDYGDVGQEKQRGSPGMMGIGAGAAWIGEVGDPQGGCRDDRIDGRRGGAGPSGWGPPDQDTGFWLLQPPSFGLLAPMMMSA